MIKTERELTAVVRQFFIKQTGEMFEQMKKDGCEFEDCDETRSEFAQEMFREWIGDIRF